MYDHYCGVLGTPIGEKNHARFWWYLCIQTMALCYAIGIVHSGFRDTIYVEWYDNNSYHLWVALLLYFLTLFVGSLWIFHTWLACTNVTSYEFMRSHQIDYLQGTKDFDLPYSQGICTNLTIFCGGDGLLQLIKKEEWKPTQWEIPKAIVRDGSISDNIWVNKYWSCC
jgi:palmitoyltransferase